MKIIDIIKTRKNLLRSKLAVNSLVMAIIPIILIPVISITMTANLLGNSDHNDNINALSKTALQVQNFTYNTYLFSEVINNMPFVDEVLRETFPTQQEKLEAEVIAGVELYQMCKSNPAYSGIYIYGENGVVIGSDQRDSRVHGAFKVSPWYSDVMKSNRTTWWGPGKSVNVDSIDSDIITFSAPIIDREKVSKKGVLLIEFHQDVLQSMIEENLENNRTLMIVNQNKDIVAVSDKHTDDAKSFGQYSDMLPFSERWTFEDLSNMNSKNFTKTERANIDLEDITHQDFGIHTSIMSISDPLTGWHIINLVEQSELLQSIWLISIVIVITIFAILVIYTNISVSTAEAITAPLNEMLTYYSEVEKGRFDLSIPVEGVEEIAQLRRGFNNMVSKLGDLVEEVYHEQRQLRKAEYEVLQMQINPHFLYNTLDSIIWLALEKDNDQVIRLTKALIQLYRTGLSRGKDTITVDEEVKHAQSYLEIQKIRYGDTFDYHIDVDNRIGSFRVLKLILQPIIENAIYHGAKRTREKSDIFVKGYEQGGCIVFEICDTGAGMDKQTLQRLRNAIYDNEGEKLPAYGVLNVHQRIALLFGQQYGLEITSEPGKGTIVTIRIPIQSNQTEQKPD